jgi:MYXO-CTERM domain-containing protein
MVLTHVWTGVDYGSPSDASLESPPLDVAATENFTLTFNYRHQFDESMGVNWDGGVIEVSTNDGMTWTDIGTYGPVAQYTGTIGDPMNQAVNVLKGRKGFVGQSPSWPAMDSATIDLGNQLAGETVKIRFRVGSDDGQGAYGWDVDDIVFSGITNKPFPATIPNTNPCTAPPIADAGQAQTVESGDLVILDGSKSSDPKMLPLMYAWSALGGPMVTLDGANSVKSTFTAPSVNADTPMIFLLSISDGKGSASATTQVLVKPSTKSIDGCGCSTVGSPSGAISPLVGVALLALRRRRRIGVNRERDQLG